MIFFRATQRVACFAVLAGALAASSLAVGANPTPAALLTAGEIVKKTGATELFGPLIAGVVEQAKLLFLQQNPGLSKDLNEISAKMRADLSPRMSELTGEVVQLYAAQFTEQELKDLLVFYNSPVGKKLLTEQPKIINASLKFAQDWANKLSDEVTAKMRTELIKKGHAL